MSKLLNLLSFIKVDPQGPWPIIGRLFRDSGRKHALGYIVATFFMCLVAASTALSAWILRDVVNQVFVDRNVTVLGLLVVGVVLISLVRGISLYASTLTLTKIGNAIVAEMQMRVFRRLLDLGMNYYDRTHSSDLISAMSVRSRSAGDVLNTILTSFGRDLLSVIGLVSVMIIQSPWMTLIVLVIAPIAILGVGRLVHRMRNFARAEFTGVSQIISVTQEVAQGVRIVKAFNLESVMYTRMNDAVNSLRRRGNKVGAIRAQTSPLMETLGGLAVAGVMIWAGYETIYANAKPGAFVSFVAAILLAYEPAKRLANTRVAIERNVAGVRFLFRILDTKPSMSDNSDGPELKIERGDVVFRNVTFSYRKSAPVLSEFDFHAPAGKVTALVGPSGAGKSTVISLIERYYDVRGGSVEIDGQNIAEVRLASLRDQIALVSQDTVMFRASIRENIRFGRASATDAEVEDAARNAMAHDFIMETKEGYDTVLEDGGIQLSGGQKQRVAIARAMLRDAPIILLDEATSSLEFGIGEPGPDRLRPPDGRPHHDRHRPPAFDGSRRRPDLRDGPRQGGRERPPRRTDRLEQALFPPLLSPVREARRQRHGRASGRESGPYRLVMAADTAQTPQERAAGLSIWKGPVDPKPIIGGTTNVNLLVDDAGSRYVVRVGEDLPVHQIMRFNERAAAKAAHAAGVSPEVVHTEPGIMVMAFVEGRTCVAADVRDAERLKKILPLLKRVHRVMPRYLYGPILSFWPFHVIHDYATTLEKAKSRYASRLPDLVDVAASLELAVGPIDLVFGHNDLLPQNLIDDGSRIWLIDWDYAGFNSPLFDLANLASHAEFDAEQEAWMLSTYFGRAPDETLLRSYRAMKCASLLREAMWSMVSEIYSQITFDFPAYTRDYMDRFARAHAAFLR